MELTVDMLTTREFHHRGRDRYYPFEANGVLQFNGYVQLPAAINNTLRQGLGLYDSRERKIIQQPNPHERLDRLTGTRDHRLKQVTELDLTIGSVRKVHGIEVTPPTT